MCAGALISGCRFPFPQLFKQKRGYRRAATSATPISGRSPMSCWEGGGISARGPYPRAPISARADILRRDIGVSVFWLQREMNSATPAQWSFGPLSWFLLFLYLIHSVNSTRSLTESKWSLRRNSTYVF